FLLREGNAKFGHGKSPSPQTTRRSEKENRPGSTCQSKIAKLLVPYLINGAIDTAAVVACIDKFSENLTKKSYMLLDNAPMHRSKAFVRHIPKWVKKGLILKYLPPYSPELNLIEI